VAQSLVAQYVLAAFAFFFWPARHVMDEHFARVVQQAFWAFAPASVLYFKGSL
jgi:hypothetical protein